MCARRWRPAHRSAIATRWRSISSKVAPPQFRRGTHTLEPIDACQLLVPELTALYYKLGPLDGVDKIVLRTGTRTGETLVVIDGEVPAQADEWEVAVVHRQQGRLTRVIGADHDS